jgi:hypothetical protein
MPAKPYKISESTPMSVADPAVAYQTAAYAIPPIAVKMQEDDGFPPAYDLKKLDSAIARAERGEAVRFATMNELDSYLDALIDVRS